MDRHAETWGYLHNPLDPLEPSPTTPDFRPTTPSTHNPSTLDQQPPRPTTPQTTAPSTHNKKNLLIGAILKVCYLRESGGGR